MAYTHLQIHNAKNRLLLKMKRRQGTESLVLAIGVESCAAAGLPPSDREVDLARKVKHLHDLENWAWKWLTW